MVLILASLTAAPLLSAFAVAGIAVLDSVSERRFMERHGIR